MKELTKRITFSAVLDDDGKTQKETAKFTAFDDGEMSSQIGIICEDTITSIVATLKDIVPPEFLTRIKAEL